MFTYTHGVIIVTKISLSDFKGYLVFGNKRRIANEFGPQRTQKAGNTFQVLIFKLLAWCGANPVEDLLKYNKVSGSIPMQRKKENINTIKGYKKDILSI